MLAQVGLDFRTWMMVLGVSQILLGIAIAGVAVPGYLRNNSRPMLLLGIGIVSLTIAPVLVRLAFQRILGLQVSAIIALSFEVFGLGLILFSIVVARANRS